MIELIKYITIFLLILGTISFIIKTFYPEKYKIDLTKIEKGIEEVIEKKYGSSDLGTTRKVRGTQYETKTKRVERLPKSNQSGIIRIVKDSSDDGSTKRVERLPKSTQSGITRVVKHKFIDILELKEAVRLWDNHKTDAEKKYGHIRDWNVSQVTSMIELFNNTLINDDISGWDVSNVTDMSDMFRGATSFNQDISGWDVSNVTDMSNMFSDASSFNQDISGWDVSNVTDMYGMFSDASSFNQDISGWDVSNVTDMRHMFAGPSLPGMSFTNGGKCLSQKYKKHKKDMGLPDRYFQICKEDIVKKNKVNKVNKKENNNTILWIAIVAIVIGIILAIIIGFAVFKNA